MKKHKVKLWNDFTCLKTLSECYPCVNSHETVVSIKRFNLIHFRKGPFYRKHFYFFSRYILNIFSAQFISVSFLGCWRFANLQHARTDGEYHVVLFTVLPVCDGTIRCFFLAEVLRNLAMCNLKARCTPFPHMVKAPEEVFRIQTFRDNTFRPSCVWSIVSSF
jgi:hypothetical protein